MHGLRLSLVSIAAALVLGACGDDDHSPYGYIGGACRSDFDCAPGADCHTGGSFPNGTCTLPCSGHIECPPSTACVDTQGGLCLPRCNGELQCRPEYNCKDRDDRDGAGKSFVCIK